MIGRWSILGAAIVAAALLVLAPAASAAPCGDEYTGPDGGSWAIPSNWSAGVPGAASVVCWSAAETVVVGEGAYTAGSIAAGGGLSVEGTGALDLTAPEAEASSLSGSVRVAGSGRLELHTDLSCSSAGLDGGEILDDGAIGCAVVIGSGTLAGAGSVGGAVVNEGGTVAPGDGEQPGGLSVGSYRQGSGATLAASDYLAGAAAGANLLRVAGPVSLAGTVSIQPAAFPAGFLLIDSSSEPQGYFTAVKAPTEGGPWTVAYGPSGAVAVTGGSAPLHAVVSGPRTPGSTAGCGIAEGWEPRGAAVQYSWKGPISAGPVPPREVSEKQPLIEALSDALAADHGPTFLLPGSADGRTISCSVTISVPAGGVSETHTAVVPPPSPGVIAFQATAAASEGAAGSQPTVRVEGTAEAEIGGPQATLAPRILGRVLPGHTLTCSPGRWEGSPGSFTYAWQLGTNQIATGPTYRVGRPVEWVLEEEKGATLRCLVTAHYGAIGVPAEATLAIPGRPQPTLCPRRPVTLVSVRRAGGALLLFGAAVQRHFGQRVYAQRTSGPGRRWRGVAQGRVNGSGYFELRVPRRLAGAGSYRVEVGGAASEAVPASGLLQIASDRSRRGVSEVVLRLARSARGAGTVTVYPLTECSTGAAVTSARLVAGGELALRLSVERGSGAGYYLARLRTAHATRAVELIVPALPERELGFLY